MAVSQGSHAIGSDDPSLPLQAAAMQAVHRQTHRQQTLNTIDGQTGRQIGRQTDILKYHLKKSFL